jgi:DNA-directed RNA polymerase subunit RPC12/RpoP
MYQYVFTRGLLSYLSLLEDNNVKYPLFNGKVCKKYIFEQMRIYTEMFAWIEEYLDFDFVKASPIILHAQYSCFECSRDINTAMQYYIQKDLLCPSEKRLLFNYHKNLRRVKKRLHKRIYQK